MMAGMDPSDCESGGATARGRGERAAAFEWAERYRVRHTPWDCGGPHPELSRRLAAGESALQPAPGRERALVPGCGRGWDAIALAEQGWRVTAIDVVAELGPLVAPHLEPGGGRFIAGDALSFEDADAYRLFFEHTFFCTLPPPERPRWGELVRRCLAPGGHLAAIVFPVGRPAELGGPPFGIATADLDRALGEGFTMLEEGPVGARVERREWEERWALWRRDPLPPR